MITWQSLVPMGPSRQLFLFSFMVFALYALPERLTLVFLLCLIHIQSPASASHHCPNHKCHFKITRKKRLIVYHRLRNKTIKAPAPCSSRTESTEATPIPLFVKSSTMELPASPISHPSHPRSRSPRCLWCDSYGHLQDGCKELADAIDTGKVLYRSTRIVNAITGKEFAPRISRGGMRVHLKLQKVTSAPVSPSSFGPSSFSPSSFSPSSFSPPSFSPSSFGPPSFGPPSFGPQSFGPLSLSSSSVDVSSSASSSVTPSSITKLPAVPQTENPGTVLATSYEATLSEFIKELSNYGINLDSMITSISTCKDGTTGYNITTSTGREYQILEKSKTYTGPRFVLLRSNKASQ